VRTHLLVALLSLSFTVIAGSPPDCRNTPSPGPIENEILVKFGPVNARAQAMLALNATEIERLDVAGAKVEHWRVPNGQGDLALAALQKRTDVVYAEHNASGIEDVMPNDPLATKYQWWVRSPTTTCGPEGTPGVAWCSPCPQPVDADVDLEDAWTITTGILDDLHPIADAEFGEVDATHPDRLAARWINPGEIAGNGIDDDHNGFIDDVYGWDFWLNRATGTTTHYEAHSTAVAGMIGGGGNNGYGGVGAAWNVSVMSLGVSGSVNTWINALNYAVGKNARVINYSLGTPTFTQTLHDAICAAPIIVTASSGNQGFDLDNQANNWYPAKFDCANIITVGASNCTANSNGQLNFNFGATTVDLVAPGADIVTDNGPLNPGPCVPSGRAVTGCAWSCQGCAIVPPACGSDDPNVLSTSGGCGPLVELSGTSFSAPLVAGILSLGYSIDSGMTITQAKNALLTTCDVSAPYQGKYVCNGKANAYRFLQSVQTLGGSPPGRCCRK